MNIALGSDHAGYVYKEKIGEFLQKKGRHIQDFGTRSEEPVDYPLYIRPVAEAVNRGIYERGIVLGGSGNGEAMVANRVRGIRCALCWNRQSAILSRKHNDANMLSLGARLISLDQALEIVGVWLETPFEGGRHVARIKQIDQKEGVAGPFPQKRPATGTGAKGYDLLISFRYIKYMEGKNALEFQVDPGLKTSSVIHIPSAEAWKKGLPEWARHRREEILDRIKKKSAHLDCVWQEY